MNKHQIKNELARIYGFSARKIILLELSYNKPVFDYALFEVCGVTYTTNPDDRTIAFLDEKVRHYYVKAH